MAFFLVSVAKIASFSVICQEISFLNYFFILSFLAYIIRSSSPYWIVLEPVDDNNNAIIVEGEKTLGNVREQRAVEFLESAKFIINRVLSSAIEGGSHAKSGSCAA